MYIYFLIALLNNVVLAAPVAAILVACISPTVNLRNP